MDAAGGSDQDPVTGNYGILGNGILRSYIDNVQIQHFGDDGVRFQGGAYSYIRGCSVVANNGNGIYFENDGSNPMVNHVLR